MEMTPHSNEITAAEARKIAENGIGLASAAELSKIYEKIRVQSDGNHTTYLHPAKVSPAAERVLKDKGFSIEDKSWYPHGPDIDGGGPATLISW